MGEILNKGEYNETAWATSLGVLGVLGADALLSNFVKRRYGGNAPDTLVAGWSLVLGSWVYGTVAQFPNNGLAGALSNFIAVSPYALSLAAAVKYLNVSNAPSARQNSLSKKALLASLVSGVTINAIATRFIKDNPNAPQWIVPMANTSPKTQIAGSGIDGGDLGALLKNSYMQRRRYGRTRG